MKMLKIWGLAYKKVLKNYFGKIAFLPYGNSSFFAQNSFCGILLSRLPKPKKILQKQIKCWILGEINLTMLFKVICITLL